MAASLSFMSLLSITATVLLSAACQRSPTVVTMADLNTDERSAAHRIAEARCDRQTRECELRAHVSYATRDACVRAMLLESARDAELDGCADDAIDARQLDACVAEIRKGQCGTGIKRVAACRREALCRYESEEGTI